MTTGTKSPTKTTGARARVVTKEERDATIRKTLAEAASAEAQAREHDALADSAKLEQELVKHQIESARIEAAAGAITLDQLQRTESFQKVSDIFFRSYRFDDVVSERSVRQAMTTMTAWHRSDSGCDMTLYLSSPGGGVVEGLSMIDGLLDLRRNGHKITTVALGLCASMSVFIAQAGDHRQMGKYATLLLHEGSLGAVGSRAEVEDTVKMTDKLMGSCWSLLAERTQPINPKTTVAFWKKFVQRKDISLTAQESLELGLVDEIL